MKYSAKIAENRWTLAAGKTEKFYILGAGKPMDIGMLMIGVDFSVTGHSHRK